eukprot:194882_1
MGNKKGKNVNASPSTSTSNNDKGNTSTSSEVAAMNPNNIAIVGSQQRRVDIARMEATVNSLLNQLRPTLEATARRAERRLTQTSNEKEREMEDEINGVYDDAGRGHQGKGSSKNGNDPNKEGADADA